MRILMVALALLIAAIACAAEPLPTYTPYPSLEPLPTHTPYPTLEPVPTYTPYPTLVPLPTHTPAPTPTAIVITTVQQNNWTQQRRFDGAVAYTTVNSIEQGEMPGGPWWLMITCGDEGIPGVFVGATVGDIFSGIESPDPFEQSVLVAIDGVVSERKWKYYPSDDRDYSDLMGAGWSAVLIGELLEAETLELAIPTDGEDYQFGFRVAGLSEYISDPEEVCQS